MKINGKHELFAQIARRGLLLAALLAMVLCVATITRAQSSSTDTSAQVAKPLAATAAPAQMPAVLFGPASAHAKPASPEEKPPANGAQEGIKVHGHWTIEVKNPDGSIAAHREFENSLYGPGFVGANLLVSLLSGNLVPGPWRIDLVGTSTTPGPCSTGVGVHGQCDIIPPTATAEIASLNAQSPPVLCSATAAKALTGPQAGCYLTLGESLTGAAGVLATSFTLSGTVYADQAGIVAEVATGTATCPIVSTSATGSAVTPTTISPSACSTTGTGTFFFTGTVLATAVPVVAGQVVLVTVVISFS